jgi:hypothetical protein
MTKSEHMAIVSLLEQLSLRVQHLGEAISGIRDFLRTTEPEPLQEQPSERRVPRYYTGDGQ